MKDRASRVARGDAGAPLNPAYLCGPSTYLVSALVKAQALRPAGLGICLLLSLWRNHRAGRTAKSHTGTSAD